ncbi:MAG: hypothetical protein KDK70_17715 [Myxococcales bacterium]|nr:hypothetical protein [Myxococcales bacterium]
MPELRSARRRLAALAWCGLGPALALGCAHAAPVPCEAVGRMPGTEDFDRLPPRGDRALVVSSQPRRGAEARSDGQLWHVDLEAGTAEPLPLHGRDACSFRPHGLSTVQRIGGAWEVYVVVHHLAGDATREGCDLEHADATAPLDSIERYRWHDDGLHFVERLRDPQMTNLNDVHAIADGRLWVSNNPAWPTPRALVVDLLFGRRRGQVLLYRPVERRWSVAADRMLFPNGVLADETGEHLLVTAARGRVRLLALDGGGEAAGVARRGRARGTLDNLLRDDHGRAITTGHPSGPAFVRHVKSSAAIAPTEVFTVELDARHPRKLRTARVLRVDDGRVDAGSVALPVGEAVAVGQVYEAGVMVCRPGAQAPAP